MKTKKIHIPHIGYTVFIKPLSSFKESEKHFSFSPSAITEKTSGCSATIYINRPEARVTAPTLAHEFTHVLQFICNSRGIDFIREQENVAYIMQYLMTKAMNMRFTSS